MKVGLVIHQLTLGGAEGQLRELAGSLDPTPVVYCLSPAVSPVGDLLREAGVSVRVAPGKGLRRAVWLARELARDGVDLVHSWLYPANAVAGAAHLLAPGRPLVTASQACEFQGAVNWLANLVAFRCSRAILVNSRGVADFLRWRYLAPLARIQVVANGVDSLRFQPQACFDGPIVSIGRLSPEKNHRLFLEAAAALPERRFILVGDGPERPALERLAGPNVEFAGWRADPERVLQGAALFWLTSDREGMPNVVGEALASGVPVIATEVFGVRELVCPGVHGFIVPIGSREGLVGHSRALLQDRPRWLRMTAAARARALEFPVAAMVGATTEVYRRALPK